MTDAEHLRRFVYRETAKELELDNPALLRIHLRQFLQRFVQRKQIDRGLGGKLFRTRNRESLLGRYPAFLRLVAARMVHED